MKAAAPDFTDPTRLVSPDAVDLQLAPRSRAVDGGTELPGITDGFSGRAPDLGAYEQGAEPPHYGPRPRNLKAVLAWRVHLLGCSAAPANHFGNPNGRVRRRATR